MLTLLIRNLRTPNLIFLPILLRIAMLRNFARRINNTVLQLEPATLSDIEIFVRHG